MGKKITWRNSIFTRLIITFLSLLLPLYVFGIVVFQWSRDMMTKQIFDSMQLHSEFLINNFDSEIGNIRSQQLEFIVDTQLDLLTYASGYLSAYERSQAINRVRERLTAIYNSSKLIEKAAVHVQTIGLTINSSGSGHGSIDSITPESQELLKELRLDATAPLRYWNDRLILKISNYRQSNQNQSSVMVVEFSQSSLRKFLVNNYTEMGYESFLVLEDQGYLLSGSTLDEFQLLERFESVKRERENEVLTIEYQNKRYLMVSAHSSNTSAIIYQYIPEETVFKSLSTYEAMYIGVSVLAVIIIVLYSLFTYQLIQKPLSTLVESFRKLQQLNFNINAETEQGRINEITFINKCFNEAVKSLKNMIEQVYNHKILVQKAELKQLQAQINPHFLYNSFFVLQRRIHMGDYIGAEQLSEALGSYFQFITRNASDMVALEKEVKHAKIYAETQSIRFSNRITVEFGILPTEYKKVIVPYLILQPLVENSFEHALEQKEENGVLRIAFVRSESKLIIVIEDNGDMFEEDTLVALAERIESCSLDDVSLSVHENTAIINIHKRLRLTMGSCSGVQIKRSELGGAKIEVHLSLTDPCV